MMRLGRVLAVAAVLVATALTVAAKEFNSKFGFGSTIPDEWTAVGGKDITPDATAKMLTQLEAKGLPPATLALVKQRFQQMELIFCNFNPGFADNICLFARPRQGPSDIPTDPAELKQLGELLGANLSKTTNHKIVVSKLTRIEINGQPGIRYEQSGIVPGTVVVQYMIQAAGKNLFITFTSSQKTFDQLLPACDRFVHSIKFL